MHYISLITCAIYFTIGGVIALSSKLDFGDDSGATLIKPHQRSVPIKYERRVEVIKKDSDNLDNLGVVCTSTGCNTTASKDYSDVVKTDVVVHVKTSVDIKNKTKNIEDVPDVPVVLGTNGAGSKKNYQGIQRGLQYHPYSKTYGVNSPPLVVTNIEEAFPSLTSTLLPGNLFRAQTADGIDIKIKTLPPVLVPMPDGYQYKTDGVELKVPYFEPSYHNHYYGENSPPQVAYYPRKKTALNPVAFNNVPRSTFSFSTWNRNYPVMAQNHLHDSNCMCQTQNTQNTPGLRWYPISRSQVLGNDIPHHQATARRNDPGTQVNEKLAPLN